MTDKKEAMDNLIAQDADLINVATQHDSVAKSVVSLYRFDTENDRLRALEAIAVYKTRQSQTYAQIAGLLFKLDIAATTFEKVTTSEHREAVFNAEHAKLLRDTIKALWCEAVAETWGQGSRAHNVAQDGCDIVLAALMEK